MKNPSKVLSDQTARDKAIEDFQTNLNVEASAGTGKTTLLTQRFVQLLRSNLARPYEIVAITFTEKAAGELKERIRTELKIQGLHKEKLEIDRAPISTIHAFAASCLRERPFDAHLDPNFQILDDVSLRFFLDDLFRQWFPKALQKNQATLSRALSSGIGFDQIKRLAFSLYKKRDQKSHLELSNTEIDIDSTFEKVSNKIQQLFDFANQTCVNKVDAGYQAIENLHQALLSVSKAPTELKERAILLRLNISAKGKKSNWSSDENCKKQKEDSKEISGILEEIKLQLRRNILQNLLRTLLHFVDFIENRKRKDSTLDLDDLLIKFRDLLKTKLDVRTYFQTKFRYFLIDEFQDTDSTQAQIIWFLSSKVGQTGNWDKLELDPGKLFLVGDPKQSIYRFRKADIQIYRKATTHLSSTGKNLVISNNFRSTPSLIHWINETFQPILGDLYEPLEPGIASIEGEHSTPVVLLEGIMESGFENVRMTRRFEAESIAQMITSFLNDKTQTIFDHKLNTHRNIGTGDIAILFPSSTDIDLYEEALRKKDLPFVMDGGKMYYHRLEIHSMVQTLAAILEPLNSIAVVSALKSSLFGLSDQDLFAIKAVLPTFDYRKGDLDRLPQAGRVAFKILRESHDLVAKIEPSLLVSSILQKTFSSILYLSRFHGEQASSNLDKFLQMARSYEQEHIGTLDGFLRWIQERIRGEDRQDESLITDETENRVRLLTVHKAKGLEFPIVFLANLASTSAKSENFISDRIRNRFSVGLGSKGNRFSTPLYEEMVEEEKAHKLDELKRLLYVAATRAKNRLILCKFNRPRRSSPLWDFLNQGMEGHDKNYVTIDARTLWNDSEQAETKTPENEKPEDVEISSNEISLLEDLRKQESYFDSRKNRWLNQVVISSPTDEKNTHEESTEFNRDLEKTSNALKLGTALHRALELMNFSNPQPTEKLAAFVSKEIGLPELSTDISALIEQVLKSDLVNRINRAQSVHRELPFSWTHEGKLIEGIIDLVLQEEDGLVIIDYKTDLISSIPKEIQKRTEHYIPQINLYRNAMTALTGLSIKECLLYYVRLGKFIPIEKQD